ncbi:MAG TPA: nucleoside hydrolase, partial [Ilumatobacteraceae bacterium]
MTAARTKLVIDTDGGVDDAVAIWWAATSPIVDLVAVTTVHGNVAVATAADNVCRVLHACGAPTVPVAIGRANAIGPVPNLRPADFIHGADGLGNTFRPRAAIEATGEHAVDLLRRVVDDEPHEIVVVSIGPLTNLAAVIQADPTWPSRVRRLVVMGGAVLVQGNALPVGEANIAHDPAAADIVARAAWSTPPLLVGL